METRVIIFSYRNVSSSFSSVKPANNSTSRALIFLKRHLYTEDVLTCLFCEAGFDTLIKKYIWLTWWENLLQREWFFFNLKSEIKKLSIKKWRGRSWSNGQKIKMSVNMFYWKFLLRKVKLNSLLVSELELFIMLRGFCGKSEEITWRRKLIFESCNHKFIFFFWLSNEEVNRKECDGLRACILRESRVCFSI